MLKKPVILTLLIAGIILVGLSFNSANAALTANNAFVLEGSGFAVTEKTIKNSQIDFVISTQDIKNGRGDVVFEDGFVTLDDDDFIVDKIFGTILRDGRYLRISGTADDTFGNELDLRLFGRLIEDSQVGSIYSFTGRIEYANTEYKILYTSKLSGFNLSGIISQTPTTSITEPEDSVVRILAGSSDPGLGVDYISGSNLGARYFSVDRLAIEPGTTITFVNDDSVSHTILSGTGLGSSSRAGEGSFVLCAEDQAELPEGFSYVQSNCSFTLDGRINSGEILPGSLASVTFEEAGFYRIIDPNYPWMSLVVYSFPDVDSLILREGKNPLN